MEEGDIVEGIVKRSAVFGLFCDYEGTEFLILIPDLSWIASFCSAEQFAEQGDSIRAQIVAIDHEARRVSASVRAMHANPWKTGVLTQGKVHEGRVFRHVQCADRCGDNPGYLIEVVPGAFAMLCEFNHPLEIGRKCKVEITRASFDRRSVKIRHHQE